MSDSSSNHENDFPPKKNDNDLVREQLVAYLDGELSDELNQAIERQISEDDAVREEIQSLDQAWNALDALPLESTNHDFTQSTIAMVTMAAKEEVVKATTEMPTLRKKRRWGMAVAIVCFACAGFLLSSLIVSYRDRQLIRNLPEIHYAKTLNQIGDMEFLQAWAEEAAKSIPASRLSSFNKEAEAWGRLAAANPLERFQWAEALPPEEMAQLSDQSIAFSALTKVKQDRLRKINQQINEAEMANDLRRYALLYDQLVGKLPPIEQASLRNMPANQRINRMQKEVRYQRDRLLLEMTDTEQKSFRKAIDDVLQRIDAVDFEPMNAFIRERYRRRYPDKTLTKEQILLIKLKAIARVASFPQSERERRSYLPPNPKALTGIWNSLEADLKAALPARIQELISETKEQSKQTQVMFQLISNTIKSTSITDASAYFAEELTQKQQLEYLSLPKEVMQERLEERLSSEMFEEIDGRGDLGGDRRGRGGPPPRRFEENGSSTDFGPPRNGADPRRGTPPPSR